MKKRLTKEEVEKFMIEQLGEEAVKKSKELAKKYHKEDFLLSKGFFIGKNCIRCHKDFWVNDNRAYIFCSDCDKYFRELNHGIE